MSKQHFKIKNGARIVAVTSYPADAEEGDIVLRSDLTPPRLVIYRNGIWAEFHDSSYVDLNSTNDTATGSNATLSTVGNAPFVRLTNASLVSVDMIPAGNDGQIIVLANTTGTLITLNNDTGATAANRIITGTLKPLKMKDGGTVILMYDSASSRWRTIGGGGGDESTTTELLERIKDRLIDAPFEWAEPNIFLTDESTKVSSATASYDIANGVYKFTAAAQTLTSTQSLDPEFLTEEKDVSSTELMAFWDQVAVDANATYQVSRNGGVNWETLAMSRVGSTTDTYRGILSFPQDATYINLHEWPVANATNYLELNTSSPQSIGQRFDVSSGQAEILQQITLYINKVESSGTLSGNVYVQLIKDNGSGLPSTLTTDIVAQTQVTCSSLAVGDNAVVLSWGQVPIKAGSYHYVIATDAAYKSSFSAGVRSLRARVDLVVPINTLVSSYFNGLTWYQVIGVSLIYKIEGRPLDLRVKVTAGLTGPGPGTASFSQVYEPLTTTPNYEGHYGNDVCISGDGNVVAIGAPGEGDTVGVLHYGSVYLFIKSGGIWSLAQKIAGDGGTQVGFGLAVSLSYDGSTLAASDTDGSVRRVRVYVKSGVSWSLQQAITKGAASQIGMQNGTIALSSDGNTMLLGDYGDNVSTGAAYVFTRSAGVWTQQQKLTASDGAVSDQFGVYVDLSGDGNTAVIGARVDTVGANSQQGSSYVFTRSAGVWTQQQKLTASDGAANDLFGLSVSISSDGSTIAVGADNATISGTPNAGAVYIYVLSGPTWTQQQKLQRPSPASGDYFGTSVSLSGDGNILAVFNGFGNNSTVATIFTRSGAVWSYNSAFNTEPVPNYGTSISISNSTVTIVLGVLAGGSPYESGRAYIYQGAGGYTETRLKGYGVLYGRQQQVTTGIKNREVQTFDGTVNNYNEFTLSNFLPDPDLLKVYHVETGQVYVKNTNSFYLDGHKVVFPANTFNGLATVTLVFDQPEGAAFDNSEQNAALLAANFLGSTNAAIDRSQAGRGIFIRRPDGTLRELTIDNSDQIAIYSV
jgi:hypothetical protein